jgi:hypothetical protein
VPRIHGKPADTFWIAPAVPASQIALSVFTWVGVEFSPQVKGRIFGASIYETASSDASQLCLMWDKGAAIPLAAKIPKQVTPTPGGWLNCWFNGSIRVAPGAQLRVAFLKTTHFWRTNNGLTSFVTHNNIKYFFSFQNTSLTPVLAAITTNANLNGVDVLFQPD